MWNPLMMTWNIKTCRNTDYITRRCCDINLHLLLIIIIIIQNNFYFNGGGPIFEDQEVRSQKGDGLRWYH